jgi:N-acetylmuramoyl-L-alanine amidase
MIPFIFYLLKLIVCSGILFLYYHLALRNKAFHQWNRFYLLASVVVSLVVPFLQFTIYHYVQEAPNDAIRLLQVVQSANGYFEPETIPVSSQATSFQWVYLLYLAVSTAIFLAFLVSIIRISSIIKRHMNNRVGKIRFINTNIEGTPFSFFHFIFWNSEIDLSSPTGQQIFEHELVHVKEKHSLDKIFMQLVLVIFWINPFFWFIRKELRLVHEFIADKKSVGNQGVSSFAAMLLQSAYPRQYNSITNQFFQTSIKRRLAMLTKIQNSRIAYISRIFALPVIAVTVLAFTIRTKDRSSSSLAHLNKIYTVVIDAGHGRLPDGKQDGAVSDGFYESNIVFDIAKQIKEQNTNPNIRIILTRNSDATVALKDRVAIAKENNADVFISVHMNTVAIAPGTKDEITNDKGLEIMVPAAGHPFEKQNELLGSVLIDKLTAVYTTSPQLQVPNKGVYVLKESPCPAVLIECGFIINEKDREYMSVKKNQVVIAKTILSGIEKYLESQAKGSEKLPSDSIINRR